MARVHPGLRRRAKNARAALAERRWRADRQRWEAHQRGAMLAAGRALQAEPIESFDDDALLDHLRPGRGPLRARDAAALRARARAQRAGRSVPARLPPLGDPRRGRHGPPGGKLPCVSWLDRRPRGDRRRVPRGGRRAHEPRRRPFRRCGRLRGARRLPRRPRLADGDAVHAARPRPHRDPRRAAAGHPERGGTDRRGFAGSGSRPCPRPRGRARSLRRAARRRPRLLRQPGRQRRPHVHVAGRPHAAGAPRGRATPHRPRDHRGTHPRARARQRGARGGPPRRRVHGCGGGGPDGTDVALRGRRRAGVHR